MIDEVIQGVLHEYFEWLYNIVCSNEYYDTVSYRELLYFLLNYEYVYYYEMDKNRASDGIDLRYRFANDCGYDYNFIAQYLDNRPCSVLEMMIALALDMEENVMSDPEYGNRTAQWFWGMIVNLKIGNMTDDKFNQKNVASKITKFMTHQYKRNGEGGLFTIHNTNFDMRTHEVWVQATTYLNEYLGI